MVDNAIKNTDCGKIVVTTTTTTATTLNSHHAEDKDNPNFQNELIVKVKDSGTGLDRDIFQGLFKILYCLRPW